MKTVRKTSTGPDKADSLRDRIVQAAAKLFSEGGYDSLSMRRVAQEAECSQMAMYRYFANKEALIQHICNELYARFAKRMNAEIDAEQQPWDKMRRFLAAVVRFAVAYPDHYALIFLVRHADQAVVTEREKLGREFISGLRELVRQLMPPKTPDDAVDEVLRRMLSCLHGTAALLIAHPKAYGLNRQRAVEDVEAVLLRLIG
ncbi:transcriptional regulator, TetR family [Granulicella rosea]|uniref:Transcriptional regulator, TetR family n=1 Tax=Granulicella rosea TaxID=474952 RepID=A0A239GV00_9BACT|nr:TetR/AcrR family transcriptional regulator [Granulicella rosea]SNS72801.1 transcriptional regulator, TetR family [Granulicella rosea]